MVTFYENAGFLPVLVADQDITIAGVRGISGGES